MPNDTSMYIGGTGETSSTVSSIRFLHLSGTRGSLDMSVHELEKHAAMHRQGQQKQMAIPSASAPI